MAFLLGRVLARWFFTACALGAHTPSAPSTGSPPGVRRPSATVESLVRHCHLVRSTARPGLVDADAVHVHTTGWTPVRGSQHSSTQPPLHGRLAPGSWIPTRSRTPDLLVRGSRITTRTPTSDWLDLGSQTPPQPSQHNRLAPGSFNSTTARPAGTSSWMPVRRYQRQNYWLGPGARTFLEGTNTLADTTDPKHEYLSSDANTCLGSSNQTHSEHWT